MCGLLAACISASTTGSGTRVESRAEEPSTGFGTPLTDGPSWAPAVRTTDGLASVATSTASGFRLHTASGDKTFVPGMNLGSTTPTHQPGELAMTAADYHRWFTDMVAMGVRAVRVYTIHPPAFYDELATYNQEHPEAPLYLVQGVYLPDESYVEPGHTLYDRAVDEGFSAELADASQAVHGDLTPAPAPGHASGTWKTDVSGWVMAWIVGVEWDPAGVQRTDRVDADASPGTYFRATRNATATERWIARHMDELATAEHARGTSAPIAFANWPTADPLRHPGEPLRLEDLVGVDADHVLPTEAWPGGTFASFHAYPYYPDFLRRQKALQRVRWEGRRDAYAGYLRYLRRHYTRMPVLVTEFGVPSSLGSAHLGTNGRDQGGHTEATAMSMDADLLRLIKGQGMGAGLMFEWTDEWFKRTWNTEEHQRPGADRRQLWHDPLTNEQWFGVVATDAGAVPDAGHEITPASGPVRYVLADADASYVRLDVTFRDGVPDRFTIGADAVRSVAGDDYRIDVRPAAGTAQVSVASPLDPVRLDARQASDRRPGTGAYVPFELMVNRQLDSGGVSYAPEFQDVGRLRQGRWEPTDRRYDSLATWQVDRAHDTVRLRVPWSMLGMADPSSRTALGPGDPAQGVKVPGIRFGFTVPGSPAATMDWTWPTWNHVKHTERVKQGADVLADAFRATGR